MSCSYFIEAKKRYCKKQAQQGSTTCKFHATLEMDCGVCYEKITRFNKIVLEPCEHVFHLSCMNKLKEKVCPFCRAEIRNLQVIEKNVIEIPTFELVMPKNDIIAMRVKILCVIDWLKEHKIPLRYLPNYTKIDRINHLEFMLFDVIIIKTLQNAYMDHHKKTFQQCVEENHPYFSGE